MTLTDLGLIAFAVILIAALVYVSRLPVKDE